jgi:nicotinate phosphoribosyltransferase
MTQNLYRQFAEKYHIDYAANFSITASNDINEENLIEFNKQNFEITKFGIGTQLVTCQKQPLLGGEYKLVEIKSTPRVKFSNEEIRSTLIFLIKASFSKSSIS